MIFMIESLRLSSRAPRGQLARCMLLLQLCRTAREAIITTNADIIPRKKAEELEKLISLANAYVQGASRKDAPSKPSWSDTVKQLKEIDHELCGNIQNLVHDAEKEDSKAGNEERKAKAKIKASVGNGKRTKIELQFVDQALSGPVTRLYEVKDKTSPNGLAAVVHFSRRVETPAYFDFYHTVRGGDFPAKWQGDTPKYLYVVMNRGMFRFHVPKIPPLVRNVFTMPKRESTIYLRDSLGGLYTVKDTEPISPTALVCTDLRSRSEKSLLQPMAQWNKIFGFINPENDFDWTVESLNQCTEEGPAQESRPAQTTTEETKIEERAGAQCLAVGAPEISTIVEELVAEGARIAARPAEQGKLQPKRLAEGNRPAEEPPRAHLAEGNRLAQVAEEKRVAHITEVNRPAEGNRLHAAEEKLVAQIAEADRLEEEERVAQIAEANRPAEEHRRFTAEDRRFAQIAEENSRRIAKGRRLAQVAQEQQPAEERQRSQRTEENRISQLAEEKRVAQIAGVNRLAEGNRLRPFKGNPVVQIAETDRVAKERVAQLAEEKRVAQIAEGNRLEGNRLRPSKGKPVAQIAEADRLAEERVAQISETNRLAKENHRYTTEEKRLAQVAEVNRLRISKGKQVAQIAEADRFAEEEWVAQTAEANRRAEENSRRIAERQPLAQVAQKQRPSEESWRPQLTEENRLAQLDEEERVARIAGTNRLAGKDRRFTAEEKRLPKIPGGNRRAEAHSHHIAEPQPLAQVAQEQPLSEEEWQIVEGSEIPRRQAENLKLAGKLIAESRPWKRWIKELKKR